MIWIQRDASWGVRRDLRFGAFALLALCIVRCHTTIWCYNGNELQFTLVNSFYQYSRLDHEMKILQNSFPIIFPIIAIITSIVMSILFILISTSRQLTALENILWQILILLIGLWGTFVLGQKSARENAQELIKPHARSAFRRLLSLYQSLGRVATEIENFQSNKVDNHEIVLAKLQAIVVEQITTADDALADWEDIIPKEIQELRQKLDRDRR